MRSMTSLHNDPRFELFVTDELTPEWISFAQGVVGVFVATERDPLSALGYAVTAGLSALLIMLIARRHKTGCKDLLSAGAAVCATMPVSKADLDRLFCLLSKHVSLSRIDPTLRLLLNPIARTVRYRDKSIRLSQRAFAVLHTLSCHRGRPVSAEDLLTTVWGEAPSPDRSRQILEVYIFQVRKKLEQLGLKGAVSTVRGFGYALVQVTGESSAP
jgi:DNA-binding response OmpR family regulator